MYRKSPIRLCIEFMILFITFLVLEKSFMPINTYSCVTCILGLIMLALFVYFSENSAAKIGFGSDFFNFGIGLLWAVVLSVIPIVTVLGLEQVIFMLRGNHGLFFDPSFELGYSTERYSSMEIAGMQAFWTWAGIGLVVSLVRALFYEGAFRGFCLFINAGDDYRAGNIKQAVFYTIVAASPTVCAIVRGIKVEVTQNRSPWIGVLTIVVALANLFILAIRHGKLRYATGTIWICVFSFWIFDYFNNIFKAFQTMPTAFTYYAVVYRSFAIQLVALLVTELYLHRLQAKVKRNAPEPGRILQEEPTEE